MLFPKCQGQIQYFDLKVGFYNEMNAFNKIFYSYGNRQRKEVDLKMYPTRNFKGLFTIESIQESGLLTTHIFLGKFLETRLPWNNLDWSWEQSAAASDFTNKELLA